MKDQNDNPLNILLEIVPIILSTNIRTQVIMLFVI